MKAMAVGLVTVIALLGCQSAQYADHKRNVLVNRVEDARESQAEAQEQFTSALGQFRAIVNINDGGDLEEQYDRLNDEVQNSEAAAEEVRERIDSIEEVAEDLFDEWEDELDDYASPNMRRESRQQLTQTQQRYNELIRVMRDAEHRMDPVMNNMRDQVLHLKHNLNTRAIRSMQSEVSSINRDIDELLAAMRKSIAAADQFIRDMRES